MGKENYAIAERLCEERERLGLNQTDFGAAGGVSRVTQQNYEKGKHSPPAGYLAALSSLGVDVLYVVTGNRSGGLAPDEAALVDNYRASCPEQKASLKEVGAAFAKSAAVGDKNDNEAV